LINLSIDTGVFPDSLKKAQVTPLHKKNDPLSKTNYRPVSVLPVFSKIFEKVFETQWGSPTIFTLIGGACVPSVITFGTPRLASIA
jgi:hypothetical protein